MKQYSPGVVPVYTCSLNAENRLNCSLTNDGTCTHSRDLGIQCLSQKELERVVRNQLNSLPVSCPEPTPCTFESPNCPTTNTESTSEVTRNDDTSSCPPSTPCSCQDATSPPMPDSTGPTPDMINNRMYQQVLQVHQLLEALYKTALQLMIHSKEGLGLELAVMIVLQPWGGVVGVLLALLVVLVIGWSLSCVALVKRNSTTQKQTQ